MDNFNRQFTKQAYHKPEFCSYGNIQGLTQNVGKSGNNDGGSGSGGSQMSQV
jgi:hypothetical protein